MNHYDIVIIGGGPAGIAAAITSGNSSLSVLLIEREAKLGGILKQCIHDGFGLARYKEKLSGPEYAEREIEKLSKLKVAIKTLTFVSRIEKSDSNYRLQLITRLGIEDISTSKLILATGCRERTGKQVAIHGTNPSGVLTAGSAQYYMNILGQMPMNRTVILGSGDIGLIMARRITLEGGHVLGVYEIKREPSGLTRNLVQCLDDFNIPLFLSKTVTKVYGHDRLTGVQIMKVDASMQSIAGTEEYIECDSLILSVGLIPENEIAESLNVPINKATKGPFVDQGMETLCDGIYSCGNALHVSDVADLVSETGELAAKSVLNISTGARQLIPITHSSNISYVVPSHIDIKKPIDRVICYFRSSVCLSDQKLNVNVNGVVYSSKLLRHVRPPEMERITLDLSKVATITTIEFKLEPSK